MVDDREGDLSAFVWTKGGGGGGGWIFRSGRQGQCVGSPAKF